MQRRTEIKWHHDGESLIEMLRESYPEAQIGQRDLCTEAGRINLAWEIGMRSAVKEIEAAVADSKRPDEIIKRPGVMVTIEDLSTERGRLNIAVACGAHHIYQWLRSLKESQNDPVLRRRASAGADSQRGAEAIG